MLRFYYDFMDKFVDRCNFEYCEMDTDSAYMALAAPDFCNSTGTAGHLLERTDGILHTRLKDRGRW